MKTASGKQVYVDVAPHLNHRKPWVVKQKGKGVIKGGFSSRGEAYDAMRNIK